MYNFFIKLLCKKQIMKPAFKYILDQEWEAIEFPITISSFENIKAFYGFGNDTKIKLWRDENFKLVGILSGTNANPKFINKDTFIGKGNIIEGAAIKGKDERGYSIEISGCIIVSMSSNSWQSNDVGYFFECDLQIDKISIDYNSTEAKGDTKRLDWFLSSASELQLTETTLRREPPNDLKVRIGIDEYDESNDDTKRKLGGSWSKDYANIEIEQLKFIIAQVPKGILNNHFNGLCFEFRNQEGYRIPDANLINNIKNLVSFLIGNKITAIGYSVFSGSEIIKSVCYSIDNYSIQLSKKTAMPPIKFNRQYNWGNIQWLLNTMLKNYIQSEKEYKLNEVLSRYWIALSLPLGVNLPILANAIEILAFEYLKKNGELKTETIPTEEYTRLIEAELLSLENKLSNYKDGNIILNKFKSANQRGSSEKINHFFNLLGIERGKQEKAAINLRNKMVHSARDYSKDDKIFDDLILSRVYQVLFNRVLLKLLGYEHYYIDYSIKNCPVKHISIHSGEE